METKLSGISSVIDVSKIEAMVAQLKAAAARASGEVTARSTATAPQADFANILKSALDGVNEIQQKTGQLSKAYTSGDDSVNLSDVMISAQKANIALQTTVQMRNKLVSAYSEIMNMQV